MDDSAPTAAPSTNSPPLAPHWVMARALASAALFGYIGKSIGHWLGRHITNNVTEPLLKWSMGAFWAVLAAYSSLKASAMERAPVTGPTDAVTPASANAPEIMPEPKVKVPLSLIEVDTLKDEGQVHAAPQIQRT